MELDTIKQQTTWNDAASSINLNFAKLMQAIASLQNDDGGFDESQLEAYLKENGYTTEEWIVAQGFLTAKNLNSALTNLQLLGDWFYKKDENTIVTKYNLVSEKAVSSKGLSSGGGSEEEGEGESGTTTGTYQMYKHVQSIPSAEWIILHGLGKMPNVKIVDSNTEQCYGDVFYESTDIVVIKFGGEFSGTAYLD